MSVSVFAHDANVRDDVRLYRLNDKRAAEMVASRQGEFITVDGRTAIRKLPPQEVLAERFAKNQVLPYVKGRPVGLISKPPKVRYAVRYLADRRHRWRLRFMTPESEAGA